MVTSSSAAVGCTAMVASKSALVAPIFTAMPSELDHLAGVRPDDMAADHAVGRAVDHELHERAGVAPGQRRLHRPERGLVDVDLGELLAAPALRSGRSRRHSGSENTAVGTLVWSTGVGLPPNTRVGEGVALADRDRRQRDPVGDVADRVDVRHRGLREFVDRDRAVLVELHAGGFETQALDVRPPAGREHHLVDDDVLVIGQLDAKPVIDLLDAPRRCAW